MLRGIEPRFPAVARRALLPASRWIIASSGVATGCRPRPARRLQQLAAELGHRARSPVLRARHSRCPLRDAESERRGQKLMFWNTLSSAPMAPFLEGPRRPRKSLCGSSRYRSESPGYAAPRGSSKTPLQAPCPCAFEPVGAGVGGLAPTHGCVRPAEHGATDWNIDRVWGRVTICDWQPDFSLRVPRLRGRGRRAHLSPGCEHGLTRTRSPLHIESLATASACARPKPLVTGETGTKRGGVARECSLPSDGSR